MTTQTTTPTMSVQEISARVLHARAALREAANELLIIARAMGDDEVLFQYGSALNGDDVISLIRRAHEEARLEGERWEARVQA